LFDKLLRLEVPDVEDHDSAVSLEKLVVAEVGANESLGALGNGRFEELGAGTSSTGHSRNLLACRAGVADCRGAEALLDLAKEFLELERGGQIADNAVSSGVSG